MKNWVQYIALIFGLMLLILTSCEPKEADIPTYIQIDTVKVQANESMEGTSKHQISDVWFNLNGSKVGIFEPPTRFPVIAEGRVPISMYAGIIKSGIHDFREVYPFFEPIRDTFNFVNNEIIKIEPVFKYKPEARFWIEDFEDPGMKFHANDSINYLSQISDTTPDNHLGYVYLPDTIAAFQVYTDIEIELSTTPIYMEIEYLADASFGIGVRLIKMGGRHEDLKPFTIVKANKKWNKLYLNLAEQFSVNPEAVSYDIYILFASGKGEEAHFYLDNIKIVSF